VTAAPAAAPAANATARVRRRGAGSDATPSRIDCSFVCSGCHPSARNRSFAIVRDHPRVDEIGHDAGRDLADPE
jgi:hypothetical protein